MGKEHLHSLAMARIRAPLLLLLTLGLVSSPCPSLAKESTASDEIVLGTGGVKMITNSSERNRNGEHIQVTLYVYPESGFKGVNLSANGESETQETVFFWYSWLHNVVKSCFKEKGKWWKLQAWARENGTHGSLGFTAGNCLMKCVTNDARRFSFQSLKLEAHGSSKWRLKSPGSVSAQYNNPSSNSYGCKEPPLPTTTTTQTTTTASTTTTTSTTTTNSESSLSGVEKKVWVSAAVGAAAAVGVMAVVCCKIRRNRRASQLVVGRPPESAETASKEVVRDNSLYESFECYGNTAAAGQHGGSTVTEENSLYEPFENYRNVTATGGSTVTEENSHYEPFGSYRNVAATEGFTVTEENSLYEPFGSYRNVAATGGSTVTEENSLYEPFEKDMNVAAATGSKAS